MTLSPELLELWRRLDEIKDSPKWLADRQKDRAHYLVRDAVRKGDLVRGACEYGGSGDCYGQIEGHHDDYDAPLDVRWLCQKHHRQLHTSRRRALKAAA